MSYVVDLTQEDSSQGSKRPREVSAGLPPPPRPSHDQLGILAVLESQAKRIRSIAEGSNSRGSGNSSSNSSSGSGTATSSSNGNGSDSRNTGNVRHLPLSMGSTSRPMPPTFHPQLLTGHPYEPNWGQQQRFNESGSGQSSSRSSLSQGAMGSCERRPEPSLGNGGSTSLPACLPRPMQNQPVGPPFVTNKLGNVPYERADSNSSGRPSAPSDVGPGSKPLYPSHSYSNAFGAATITLSLISPKEFTARVETGRVSLDLLNDLQLVKGAIFDEVKARWLFPVSTHEEICSTCSVKYRMMVEPIPREALAIASLYSSRSSSSKRSDEVAGNAEPSLAVSNSTSSSFSSSSSSSSFLSASSSSSSADLKPTLDLSVASLKIRLPAKLHAALAPFQQEAVSFVLQQDGRALIADEMGLGKTRTAIACAMAYQEDWPVLIICPSGAKHHWLHELTQLVSPKPVDPRRITLVESANHPINVGVDAEDDSDEDGGKSGMDHFTKKPLSYQIIIISYGLASRMLTQLAALQPGIIIADESHNLKNAKAKRTRVISALVKRAKRAILLSGTPALSRPRELFTTLNMLNEKIWSSESDFYNRYCRAKPESSSASSSSSSSSSSSHQSRDPGRTNRDAANTKELNVLLSSSIMIRRLKKDVLQNLPPKVRQIVPLSAGTAEGSMENGQEICRLLQDVLEFQKKSAAEKKAQRDADSAVEKRRGVTTLRITRLYQLSGYAKVESVLPHIKDHLDDAKKGKLLIFAHHSQVLDRIQHYLSGPTRAAGSRRSSSTNANAQDGAENFQAPAGTSTYALPVDFIRIDGGVPSKNRSVLVNTFQNTPTCRVALLSITAAGVALTLTAASTVFFAELFWNPGSLIQAEDRVHRIGQLRTVSIKYFLANGTIDNILWPLLKEKMRILGEVVEGEEGLGHEFAGKFGDDPGAEGSSSSSSSKDPASPPPLNQADIAIQDLRSLASELQAPMGKKPKRKRKGEHDDDDDDDDDDEPVLGDDGVGEEGDEAGAVVECVPDVLASMYLAFLKKLREGNTKGIKIVEAKSSTIAIKSEEGKSASTAFIIL